MGKPLSRMARQVRPGPCLRCGLYHRVDSGSLDGQQPGFARVYQITMIVPAQVAAGDNVVSCFYGGVATPGWKFAFGRMSRSLLEQQTAQQMTKNPVSYLGGTWGSERI